MNFKVLYGAVVFVLSLAMISCEKEENIESSEEENAILPTQRWDFNDLSGWTKVSHDDDPESQTWIENGHLRIYTRANTRDRKKVVSDGNNYTTGRYVWQVFVSDLGIGDQASIGAFLYHDDTHELDFEIGYGKESARAECGAADDEVLAYMTTQSSPFSSVFVPIKKGWHTLEINIRLVNDVYVVNWLIDDVLKHSITQTFGSVYDFAILCSMENLTFVGDHIPTQDNYVLFDYVEYYE